MSNFSPQQLAQLKALGIPVKALDPTELEAVVRGHRTLGELANISKDQQYEMGRKGLKFIQDGLKDKGREVFLGLEALDPYDAWVHAVLGQLDVDDENFEAAEQRFSRALSINPVSVPALVGRGELRLRLGRKSEGLADLKTALSKGLPEGNEANLARAKAMVDAAAAK